MSGPALKHWDSHSSIHEAALNEATELTELLRQCIDKQDYEKAMEVAYITIEHWETRTLCHAEAEEEGLYVELVGKQPEVKEFVMALTRDHSLMRYLAIEIKQILQDHDSFDKVMKRFDAMILIDLLHNRDEEKLVKGELFSGESDK
ncbi:MAG: hemerythrin domain-containing protein [Paenibacillaceae bacterium]